MEQKNSKNNTGSVIYMPIGMCIGISVGTALGAAYGNVGVGMCLGVGVGMCLGSALDAYMKGKKSREDPPEEP